MPRCRRLLALSALTAPGVVLGQQRLVSIGNRRLWIDCAGQPTAQRATVILITGGGGTKKDWAKVQPEIAAFVRVCSYDKAGFGDSGKTAQPQSADEIVEDLHALLDASGEKKPYILAGHSMGGDLCSQVREQVPLGDGGAPFRGFLA